MFLIYLEGIGQGLIYYKGVTGFRWPVSGGWLLTVFGGSGKRFYVFLLIINIWGLCPYIFTPTMHVRLTVGLSFTIIVAVTI